MSKRAAGRLNLELTAFIRADFSDIPFPHRFFPSFHLTPVFPQCFHSQQARSTREQGFTKSIAKGQFLSEPPPYKPTSPVFGYFLACHKPCAPIPNQSPLLPQLHHSPVSKPEISYSPGGPSLRANEGECKKNCQRLSRTRLLPFDLSPHHDLLPITQPSVTATCRPKRRDQKSEGRKEGRKEGRERTKKKASTPRIPFPFILSLSIGPLVHL